jgi:hypothetical protein
MRPERVYLATLDGAGSFSVVLPATDDADIAPAGWQYEVFEPWVWDQKIYKINAPANTTVDLRAVAPAVGTVAGKITRGFVDDGLSGKGQVGLDDLSAAALAAITAAGSGTYATQASLAAAVDGATLGEAFGRRNGQVISPWAPETPIGPEMWQVGNFQVGGPYNSSTVSPSLTANGTSNNFVRTRIGSLMPSANRDYSYRLEFDYAITVPSGWAGISVLLTDSGGTILAGSAQQYLATVSSVKQSGHIIFEFMPQFDFAWFELRLESQNNAPSGTVSISNVTLRNVGSVRRPMLITTDFGNTQTLNVFQQHRDVPTRSWKVQRHDFGFDGTAGPYCPIHIQSYSGDQAWNGARPDPEFVNTGLSVGNDPQSPDVAGKSYIQARANNNDQIWQVVTPGGPFAGTALYGNVHGGEYPRAGGTATVKVDKGAGFVTYTPAKALEACRRVQFFLPTEYRRTSDGITPFANVDRTITMFPDGIVRVDRTSTILSQQTFGNLFEWLTSHDSVSTPVLARVGQGLTVVGDTDFHALIAAPTITPSTSPTGGALAAATYSYRVTSITVAGESTPSTAATQTTTGSTSTVALSWPAVANATGYRIYGRTSGFERLVATVGPSAINWVDDGSGVAGTQSPPQVNTARRLGVCSSVQAAEVSGTATWSAFFEPRYGWCYGNIYDTEAVLSRPEVASVRTRVYNGKNYMNIWWKSPTFSASVGDTNFGLKVIPAGTVWSATHYYMTWRPGDATDWHKEIAIRAANYSALATLYPTT